MAFRGLRSANFRAASCSQRAPPTATRTLAYTAAARLPYKDDQDRDTLKPRSTEGTKSGADQDVAEDSAAFDPSKTRPETERGAGGPELESSGANQEQSKPQGSNPDGKGAGKEVRKGGRSAGGSAPKAGSL